MLLLLLLCCSVLQACYSPIDFDYMQFHRTRLGEYRRRKDAFHAEARRLFGPAGTACQGSSAQQQLPASAENDTAGGVRPVVALAQHSA
jgi:hypothetical protein